MIDRFAARASRRHTLRGLALVGSALGSTVGIVQAASAQNQTVGSTPYQNTGTLSGGPTTVTATTATGDISLDLNTVVAANNGSGTAAPSGAAISATNTGTGAITIKDVNATITGSGASNGIIATAQTGAISITQTGVVDATNAANGRGIAALSNGGTITINAAEADGGRRGIYTGFSNNPASLTTITVGTAKATGDGSAGLVNAIIGQGSQVVVNSGTASVTNAAASQGTAIFVNADIGGAQVTAGTTNAYGQNQAAIQVFSSGAVNVASTAVNTTQNSDGISIASGTNVVVNSGTITAQGGNGGGARGIVIGGNAGGGGFNSGPNGFAYDSATITSGTIATGGANSYGIYVTPTGAGTTTITSGTITTSGAGAYGIYETAIGSGAITGASTINSTGALMTSNATGIQVNAGSGAVAINNTGSISVGGVTSKGVNVAGTSGSTVTIAGGTVSTAGGNGIDIGSGVGSATIAATSISGAAIGVNAQNVVGALGITSGMIALPTTSLGNGAIAYGINASTSGAGALTINSGTITGNAANQNYGIFALGLGSGNVSVTSGSVSSFGHDGIYAQSNTSAVSVTSTGTINAAGIGGNAGGNGIEVFSTAGPVTVSSNNVATTGNYSYGIRAAVSLANPTSSAPISVASTGTISTSGDYAYGILANPANGAGTVGNSGSITTTGANAFGIALFGIGGTGGGTVSSTGSITTTGDYSSAISANSGGPLTIGSNTVTTSGQGAYGIQTNTTSGATNISSTAVTTSGGSGFGISAMTTTGALTIQSGAIATSGGGAAAIFAQSAGGAIAITSTGSISAAGNYSGGILTLQNTSTYTTGAITINATGPITTVGYGAPGISAGGGGAITINAASVQTGGTNTDAIDVSTYNADTAAINVQADTIRTTGNASNGINVSAAVSNGTSPVTIAVTNATATGSAIQATGGAAVTVTAGTTRVAGGTATAINAQSTGGFVTIASSDLGVANGRGIFASGATGASVTSGSLAETGLLALSNGYSDYALIAQVATPAQGSTIVPTGVSVNSTSLTSGSGGIRTSSLTANTAITSGSIAIAGNDTAGISASATSGNVAVTSGTVTSSGAGANAIYAQTTSGNVVITSTSAATTGALSSLGNTADAILGFTGATGNGSVTITSGTASASGDIASAIYGYGGGNVTITSGTASASGASGVTVGAYSRLGDAAVTATTTTATGANAPAVSAIASVGNATLNLGTATAPTGQGANATAGKLATVTATSVAGGGDGNAGVYALGGTGVILNIGSATSTGALTTTTTNGTTTTNRADAIYAVATNGTINATIGSATATGQGADAVRLIASGTGGGVTAAITGSLSSTSGYGLYVDPPGANMVTVASGASISGATGVSLTGATNSLVNAGSITGTAGPGIVASGQTALDNAGAIAGSGGTAVQLGATNDSVILRTGSAITGTIAGGGGTDSATLIGSSNAATSGQQVAAFTSFDNVTVQSGYWTASAPSSFATSATIASGASLAVTNGMGGLALTAPSIVDNGALVVTGSSASAGSTFGSSVVTGSGTVTLVGGQVTLDGTNSLQNTGATTVAAGTSVLITGTQGGTFVNNGMVQVGNGGTTGQFTGTLADNGTLISNRSDTYTFAGALTGTGTFIQNGSGTVVFGTNYAFTGVTQLNAGSVKLTTPVAATTTIDAEGSGTFDLSGLTQTIAQLSGASTGATISIANGALTVNQATNTSFAGTISGNGSLTKTSSGSLNLTGTNTYSGPTNVNGGRLAVNGSITSPVTVNSGAVLGGNGTLPSATIASGGTLAPGNSIGTINVPGNVTFAAGSTYQVEANAAGMADRINAGTVTINGGTVQVLAAPGTYNPITQYTIITATGGITGQFAGVTSSLAFLSPLLTYGANAVTLGLYRNDINFAAMASSPSGAAVANAIASLGFGNRLYNAVLIQTATGAPVAFNQLSGEIHATIPSLLIDSDRRVRDAVMDHNRPGLREGLGLWLQSLGTSAHSRSQGGNANVNTTRLGVVGGADYGLGDVWIGINGGWFDGRVRDPDVYSRAQIGTALIGGSVAWLPAAGRLTAQAGVTHAWHHLATTRTVTIGDLAGSYTASPQATTTQAFGELGFRLVDGPLSVTPFVRYAHDWERADGFTEIGGPAALTVARDRRSNDFGSAGVRVAGSRPIGDGLALEPNLSVGYLHGWGQLYSVRGETIGGAAFSVTGDRLGRDNLDANGGVDLVVKDQLRLGLTGYVTRSSEWRDYGGKASVSFRF